MPICTTAARAAHCAGIVLLLSFGWPPAEGRCAPPRGPQKGAKRDQPLEPDAEGCRGHYTVPSAWYACKAAADCVEVDLSCGPGRGAVNRRFSKQAWELESEHAEGISGGVPAQVVCKAGRCALKPGPGLSAADLDAKVRYEEGMRLAMAGQIEESLGAFEAAVSLDPGYFLAHFDLGGAREQLGDKDKALESYKRTVEIKPEFAEAQSQLGTLYLLHRRDYDHALQYLRAALLQQAPYVDPRFSIEHTRSQVLLNLAVTYAQKGQLGLAQGISRGLLQDPEAKGNAQRMVERTGAAMAPAQERRWAARLDPLRAQLHGGHAAEALKGYLALEKEAATASPSKLDLWDLHAGIARGHVLTGQPAAALPFFAKALEDAPHLPYGKQMETRFNLACALSAAGQQEQALAELEEVLWIERLTRNDPTVRRAPFAPKILADASLAKLRQGPALQQLLARYQGL